MLKTFDIKNVNVKNEMIEDFIQLITFAMKYKQQGGCNVIEFNDVELEFIQRIKQLISNEKNIINIENEQNINVTNGGTRVKLNRRKPKIYGTKKLKKRCYTAYNRTNNRTFAKCTTKQKSKRQSKYIQQWFENNH